MSEITRKTTVYAPEGYLMLGDLRRIVAATQEFDDTAAVEAGMEDVSGEIRAIDTLTVYGVIPDDADGSAT